jgi:hypothetical protein
MYKEQQRLQKLTSPDTAQKHSSDFAWIRDNVTDYIWNAYAGRPPPEPMKTLTLIYKNS